MRVSLLIQIVFAEFSHSPVLKLGISFATCLLLSIFASLAILLGMQPNAVICISLAVLVPLLGSLSVAWSVLSRLISALPSREQASEPLKASAQLPSPGLPHRKNEGFCLESPGTFMAVKGDNVSPADVEEALFSLSQREGRWLIKLAGVLGGILIGTGLSTLASMIESGIFTKGGTVTAVLIGVVGAFFVGLDISEGLPNWRKRKPPQPLGSSQNSNDVQARAEEMAALNGAAGDLDEGPAFGDESESSAHAQIRRKKVPQSSSR